MKRAMRDNLTHRSMIRQLADGEFPACVGYRVYTSFSNLMPSIMNPKRSSPFFNTITPGGP